MTIRQTRFVFGIGAIIGGLLVVTGLLLGGNWGFVGPLAIGSCLFSVVAVYAEELFSLQHEKDQQVKRDKQVRLNRFVSAIRGRKQIWPRDRRQ